MPFGRRLHDPADRALSVGDDVDIRLAVDRQRHRPPQFGIVEGRRFAVDEHVAGDVDDEHVADRLRHLTLDVLQLRHRDAEINLLVAGHERQQPGRDILDDPVFDAVEIRPARLPVIRIADHRDRLVRLELDELERPGADRMLPHLRRRDVTRIDRRPSGRQHRQERRLRPLQVKGDLVVALGRHLRDIVKPRLARVDAQFFLRLALQQVASCI